jgi:2-polyprenyl-3-methyl-5-hydroxy-6-metoxy-1,4-benzoquinol methylase
MAGVNQLDWNQKRIKAILDFYGHEFMAHKKVLDLGCGHGDLGGVLYRLGADITCVDARQDFLKVVSKKFEGIKVVKADLDSNWPFYGKKFDLILDLGLLCHLRDYEAHLKAVCQSTSHLVLETAVCDSSDPFKCIPVYENKNIADLSINGLGSRPSAAAIERILNEAGMSFKRIDGSKYNSKPYSYDWQEKNDDSLDLNKRRLWFASKSTNASKFNLPNSITKAPPPAPVKGYVPTLKDTNIPVRHVYPINASPKQINPGGKILKVAICISGHLRTFENNYQSLKDNILSKYDCDVFIHTWDILGSSYRFTDSKLHLLNTAKYIEKIESFYNPKKLIIEPFKYFELNNLMKQRAVPGRDAGGTISMYYKIEACNNLKKDYEKENNIIYDCVIRFRSDLHIEQPLPLDANTNLTCLHVPLHGNFGGINDQLAYGSSSVMDTYSSLYSNLENLLQAGANLNPEKLLLAHINYNNLPIVKDYIKYNIRRANGMVQDNMMLERVLGFVK